LNCIQRTRVSELQNFFCRTFLWDIQDYSSIRKNSSNISSILKKTGEEIFENFKPSTLFACWTVDNTRANMGALQELEADHPEWIIVGCIAHGLALAIRTFARTRKHQDASVTDG
jgi:hypothetical protein